ncbi:leucyl/phenylalanyl-tRNA--protein transferase [Roseovarius pelagicus]|uniref:Leucyl/phenylalanyl-tRNA--protein transferase n=1 Tax=Roseovarius pelagicus TaxID=2980108 RepID=A0ABY6DBN0_9RHOB|nr:leucyl/phenylalanyl-tRNA--protein transferase [Roseovarius pelagicus]UXX82980.1 leucyl/phenylalanyl-tRNA--protein transferase [Roseovarius pelagicus]
MAKSDDSDADFDLTPQLLLNAYAAGVFPMSEYRNDPEVYWVDPRRRGVLPLGGFHVSRSLSRRMRRAGYRVTLNAAFADVIDACADRPETWISNEIRSLYIALHDLGHAHSIEVMSNGALIGGVYGVTLGTAFFGESMFSRQRDASKLALAHLVDHLARCRFTLFDTQFITPHLATLGAVEISRAEYRKRLDAALRRRADIDHVPLCTTPYSVVQRMTQTS